MKYIRTKDYIYDSKDVVVVNENGTLVVVRGIDKDFIERNRGRTWNTGPNVVLAQADTTEELCDEFVGVDKNGNHYTHTDSVDDLIHMTYDILHITLTAIYGEIWVNDELHKVAKMNDKGELELL